MALCKALTVELAPTSHFARSALRFLAAAVGSDFLYNLEMDRSPQLRQIVDLYFDGLRDKNLAAIPWSEGVTLRAPLAAGGAEVPLVGRDTVHAYISAILPAIKEVRLEDCYVNATQTAVMGKAELTLVTGARLRVADLFEIDAAGQITAQENHFDPRPALA